jgi:copper chaperone CopZ
VSAAIGSIEGVASVEVDLGGRFAEVKLKSDNRTDPEGIRQAIRESGFSPKEADVKVAGLLVERDGKLALAVTGLGLTFPLAERADAMVKPSDARKALGKAVVVTGRLPEDTAAPRAGVPRTLELRDLALDEK